MARKRIRQGGKERRKLAEIITTMTTIVIMIIIIQIKALLKSARILRVLRKLSVTQSSVKDHQKRLPQSNEKTARNQSLLQKFYEEINTWVVPLVRYSGGNQINGTEDKKTDDDA